MKKLFDVLILTLVVFGVLGGFENLSTRALLGIAIVAIFLLVFPALISDRKSRAPRRSVRTSARKCQNDHFAEYFSGTDLF